MRIKLETELGEDVHDHQSAPFRVPPEVVSWGVRTFKKDGVILGHDETRTGFVYRECFHYAIPDIEKLKEVVEAVPIAMDAALLHKALDMLCVKHFKIESGGSVAKGVFVPVRNMTVGELSKWHFDQMTEGEKARLEVINRGSK